MKQFGMLPFILMLIFFLIAPITKSNISEYRGNDVRDESETIVFFIQDDPDHEISAYIYDSERNHLLVCTNYNGKTPAGVPADRNTDEWIVLPGNIRAYVSPSMNSQISDVILSYPQKIEAGSNSLIKSDNIEWVAFRYNNTVYYLPAPLLARRSISSYPNSTNLPIGYEPVDRHTTLPPDYKPNDLVPISQKWNFHDKSYPKYLRSEAVRAIENMLSTARNQGINIRVFSAYRSYEKQRYLYLREIEKNGLRQISVAKPGHSEHQLGTAVDLCGLDPVTVANPDFGESPEGKWLEKYCEFYGFVNSYGKDNVKEHGYIHEPWHYRYIEKQLKNNR